MPHPPFTIAFALRGDEVIERAQKAREVAARLRGEHCRLRDVLESDVAAHRKAARRLAKPA